MGKVIKIYNFKLESENEYTKIFKEKDTEIYFSKAYDEDSNKHYVIASIPHIIEVNASDIKYPFVFDEEYDRDSFFNSFDETNAGEMINEMVKFIKEQNEKQNKQP